MGKLSVFALAFLGLGSIATAFAACPRLEGEYWCLTSPEQLDLLEIAQSTRGNGVTEYRVSYSTIGGDPEVIRADETGIPDDEGWITKCTRDGRLLSVRADGGGLGAIYLDEEDAFVREYNDRVVQRCPRKQSDLPRTRRETVGLR